MLTLIILKKIIAKLNFLYSVSFCTRQHNVQWLKHRVFLFCFIHDRAALSQVYFQHSRTYNTSVYPANIYSLFFLIYFLLSVLTNHFQVLWQKTLLQNCSPYPYSSKIPAVSALLHHSKMVCSQAPQAKSTKLTQALDKEVGYQNIEVRGVTFISFPWWWEGVRRKEAQSWWFIFVFVSMETKQKTPITSGFFSVLLTGPPYLLWWPWRTESLIDFQHLSNMKKK